MAEKLAEKIVEVAKDVANAAETVATDIKDMVKIEPKEEVDDTKEKRKSKPAAKRAGMTVKAKKKTAVARGTIKKGKGKITINHMNLNSYARGYVLSFIKEPLEIAPDAIEDYDIAITVQGSGYMSQAVAVRSCIAKAIVRAKGKKYKDAFQMYDRMLLVDDVRKVETKKPLGTKARKKRQQSKR